MLPFLHYHLPAISRFPAPYLTVFRLAYIINITQLSSESFHPVHIVSVILRKPFDNEIDACARLIYTSGPDLYRYIFASQEPEIYDYFKFLCERTGSLFSKEHIIIEEECDIIRGLILAYPARDMLKISIRMFGSLPGVIRTGGFTHFIKIMFRMGLNRYFPRTSNDELFISNIAVFEEYRGKGIGKSLLKKAEDKARENDLKKLSLYVETDNLNAIGFYENFGFTSKKESLLPQSYHKHNLVGFIKMVKEIEPV